MASSGRTTQIKHAMLFGTRPRSRADHRLRWWIVRGVPWWGVGSSAAAPVLMVAGWSVAARLQPRPVDLVAEPVSALAAVGAADRWVMSATFVVVGACVFVTGLALRPAGAAGRLMLMAGAVAGMLVAVNPEHPGTSFPVPHMIRGGWVRRGGGLAGRGLAARAAGALGPAAGGIGWRRRGAAGLGGLVRCGADHRRRAGRSGGTYFRRRPGAVAAGRGRLLPSCRQEKLRTRPEPVRPAPGRRSAQTGRACARPAVPWSPQGSSPPVGPHRVT